MRQLMNEQCRPSPRKNPKINAQPDGRMKERCLWLFRALTREPERIIGARETKFEVSAIPAERLILAFFEGSVNQKGLCLRTWGRTCISGKNEQHSSRWTIGLGGACLRLIGQIKHGRFRLD